MAVQNFEQIVDKARAAGRSSRVVIAGADAENILLGAFHAAEEGFAYPVLVGEEAKIRPLLERLGFACEDFGGGAVLVREIPADLDAGDLAATLEAFAENLRQGRSLEERRESLLHTMACKAAIKGGWTSDPAELRVLVEQVQSGRVRFCPHGRPVAVKLTGYEIEKMFGRA